MSVISLPNDYCNTKIRENITIHDDVSYLYSQINQHLTLPAWNRKQISKKYLPMSGRLLIPYLMLSAPIRRHLVVSGGIISAYLSGNYMSHIDNIDLYVIDYAQPLEVIYTALDQLVINNRYPCKTIHVTPQMISIQINVRECRPRFTAGELVWVDNVQDIYVRYNFHLRPGLLKLDDLLTNGDLDCIQAAFQCVIESPDISWQDNLQPLSCIHPRHFDHVKNELLWQDMRCLNIPQIDLYINYHYIDPWRLGQILLTPACLASHQQLCLTIDRVVDESRIVKYRQRGFRIKLNNYNNMINTSRLLHPATHGLSYLLNLLITTTSQQLTVYDKTADGTAHNGQFPLPEIHLSNRIYFKLQDGQWQAMYIRKATKTDSLMKILLKVPISGTMRCCNYPIYLFEDGRTILNLQFELAKHYQSQVYNLPAITYEQWLQA